MRRWKEDEWETAWFVDPPVRFMRHGCPFLIYFQRMNQVKAPGKTHFLRSRRVTSHDFVPGIVLLFYIT